MLSTPEILGAYRRLAFWLLAVSTISALVFIVLVDRPVFDDRNNLPDVQRYAHGRLSVEAIRAHINPTGPTSFLWMAAAAHLTHDHELRAARLAVLASWLMLGAGVMLGVRMSRFARLWFSALFVTLAFPHAATAMATVLTEGPALLFATLGALVWLESVSSRTATPCTVFAGVLAGFSMGLAVTCRQYYVALLMAAAVFVLVQVKTGQLWGLPCWRYWAISASLGAAAVPVLLLLVAWRGLSSPGMVTGMSYGNWQSAVGLNFRRPLIAAFYVAFYLMLLTFPAMLQRRPGRWLFAIVLALLGGIGAAYFRASLLQPGPLASFLGAVGRVPKADFLLFAMVAAVTIYSGIALCSVFRDRWADLPSSPPLVFSLLVILLFLFEQTWVGGNIPFYERYVLQLAPFLGITAFAVLPRLTRSRVLMLVFLCVVGHGLLWRHAFGPRDGIGVFEEGLDTGGGSGFSFGDLLADRAGTTFALVATYDDAPARLATGFRVDDFFP